MKAFKSIGFVGLLFCAPFIFAQSMEAKKQKIQKKIQDQKQQLQKVEERELSIHEELRRYSLRFDEIKADLYRQRKKLKQVKVRIETAKDKIKELNERKLETQDEVFQLTQRLHRMEHVDTKKLLFMSQENADFYSWRRVFDRWIQSDVKKLQNYKKLLAELEEEKIVLSESQQKQNVLLQGLNKKQKSLAVKRKEHKKLLALVSNQKTYYAQNIKELEAASQKLNKLISNFSLRQNTGFGTMQGKLPLPVKGKLEKRFGPYRDTKMNVQLYHKGIDLRAKTGAPVKAVFDGKVVYADWFSGYGKVVILNHGGGYFSLYAHLSRIFKKKGQSVVVADLLGEVGDTASIKGSYLYFELREKGLSVDPLSWLDF